MRESSALPVLQNGWLGELTGIRDLTSEPKSTCGECVMCAGKERSGSRLTFSPEVKCCSYIPHVSNFLAGRSLAGSGGASVRARMRSRAGVTPLGLGLSHADVGRMVAASPRFGRTGGVRCPHYQLETSSCGIWENRNAVCATWFCKHERGAVSQHFWHAVRDLLMAAEERLAFRCLTAGGVPDEQVDAVMTHRAGVREAIRLATAAPTGPPTGSLNPPEDELPGWYERMWGDWLGREEDWFVHCAEVVEAMSSEDVGAWMDGVRHLVEGVTSAWTELTATGQVTADLLDPAETLAFAPGFGSEVDGDVLRLVGYSAFDPLTLPAELLAPLEQLDVDEDLIRQLADFGLIRTTPTIMHAAT